MKIIVRDERMFLDEIWNVFILEDFRIRIFVVESVVRHTQIDLKSMLKNGY